MNLSDVLGVLRRRWLTFVLTLLAIMAAAVGAIAVQTPVYEASATLSLTPTTTPTNVDRAISLLPQISAIAPAYAAAVTAQDTKKIARGLLGPGHRLASASVATFTTAPTVLRITTRSTSPIDAQLSAAAYVSALEQRSTERGHGQIGPAGLLELLEIDSPTLPTSPVSPRKKLTLGAGLLLGLVIAFLASWLRDQSGGAVEDAEQLAHATGLQVYGEIPESRRVPTVHSIDAFLNDDRLRSVSEAMRDLAVALQLTQVDSDSILVTSPAAAQGKTTVAFGVAVALARSGVETLLVDGDLRKGRLDEIFADERTVVHKSPGLVDVLRGMPLSHAVQHTGLPRLQVVSSGELMDDPNELLDAAFPQVLREMERDYAVVVDATPLMPINDARLMAKFCSGTLIVVSAGQVSRRDLKRAIDRLKIIDVTPTAAVMNRARTRDSARYGSYLRPTRRTPSDAREASVS